jgi:Ran GTPase-activating protein (RanGAP) involved in mRNA processing and transport
LSRLPSPPPEQNRRSHYSTYLADPEEEKKFLIILESALETYISETGSYPTKMPIGNPSFRVENHHLKVMARILKNPKLSSQVKSFHASYWPQLSGMGLKWILNALHHNKNVTSVRIEKANFTRDDGLRLVRFIQTSPHITKLEVPMFTFYEADHSLRLLLQEMPTNKSLLSLDLSALSFSETTFNMLLNVISTNTTLQKLNLRSIDFSYHNRAQRFMQALIDNPNTALRKIRFPLMRGAVLWTAQMLQYNNSLTHIDLSRISLGTHSALLQKALQCNKKLQSLDLSDTMINDTHLATLLEPLWFNNTLQHLNLSDNSSLSSESARNLCDMLMQNTGLTSLSLDRLSGISKDKLAKRLGTALRVNSSIHILSISASNTEIAGANVIGEALAINHSLHSLNLSRNPQFDDSCINALLKGLKTNYGLHTLILDHCKIGDSAVKAMVPWLKVTTTLTVRLDISENRVSTASYGFLREAIAQNPALRKFTLGHPTIQPSVVERLAALRSDILSFFSSSSS